MIRRLTPLKVQQMRFASTDVVSQLYFSQIQDVFKKQSAAGGSLASTSPELKKQLEEQLSRLAQKHGIVGAAIDKLNFKAEAASVESSVTQLLEGRPLGSLLDELDSSKKAYEVEHAKRVKEMEQRKAISSGSAELPKLECCNDDPNDYKYWTP